MPKRFQQCIWEIILRTLAFKNGASSLRMSPIWLLVPLIKKNEMTIIVIIIIIIIIVIIIIIAIM